MTIFDFRCDRCGTELIGPSRGPDDDERGRAVRFTYHPGDPALSDNSSMVCSRCWSEMTAWLGVESSPNQCSVCETALDSSLYIQAGPTTWRLCPAHAVELLNSLRTVMPKLDLETFVLPSQPGSD